jgi:hypothetical protein
MKEDVYSGPGKNKANLARRGRGLPVKRRGEGAASLPLAGILPAQNPMATKAGSAGSAVQNKPNLPEVRWMPSPLFERGCEDYGGFFARAKQSQFEQARSGWAGDFCGSGLSGGSGGLILGPT